MKQYRSYSFILLIFTFAFYYGCDNKKPKFYESKQFITKEQAKTLWQGYNNPMDTTDANNVWFSIKELENFIAYAKANCDTKRHDLTGMRIYFGRYPNDTTKYKMKAGQQTLFFSPTGKLAVKKGQFTDEAEESATNDEDLTDLYLLDFGTSGWPPYRVYEP